MGEDGEGGGSKGGLGHAGPRNLTEETTMTIDTRVLDLQKDGMAGFIAAPRRKGRCPAVMSLFHGY